MTFSHPGVLISKKQLDFVIQQVRQKADPIYTAFVKAVASPYGNTNYKLQGPPPGGVIDCGSYNHPDIGCSAADMDAAVATTQALLWAITGNKTYADKSIEIMDHYASTLAGYNNSNAPLQAAWDAEKWPLAAEIIKYTNAGWPSANIKKFETMLTKIILPRIHAGSGANGNWELSMIDGMFGISVFTEDTDLFNNAVQFWRQRIPAYYYNTSDGKLPVPPPRGHPSWFGQTVFNSSVNGVCQETCRDFGHTLMGTAAATHAAETAGIQGTNLFSEEKERISEAMEFHTNILVNTKDPVPKYVCNGTGVHLSYSVPTLEIGYNALHNRMGMKLPNTLLWLTNYVRTSKVPVNYLMVIFETLTHGADAGFKNHK